jgi:hypothetical protein
VNVRTPVRPRRGIRLGCWPGRGVTQSIPSPSPCTGRAACVSVHKPAPAQGAAGPSRPRGACCLTLRLPRRPSATPVSPPGPRAVSRRPAPAPTRVVTACCPAPAPWWVKRLSLSAASAHARRARCSFPSPPRRAAPAQRRRTPRHAVHARDTAACRRRHGVPCSLSHGDGQQQPQPCTALPGPESC